MRHLFLIPFLLGSFFTYSQTTSTYNSNDLTALKATANNWEKYWNIHDMDSMGTLLTKDVDFVNVAGTWLKGRKEVIQDHKQKHQSFRFKNSIWKTDSVKIKYIQPYLAIMHIGWEITGAFESENVPRPPGHGIFTWVLYKQNAEWLILTAQNTNIKEAATATH